MFSATEFEGELVSSEEGEICWVDKKAISNLDTVEDFDQMLEVMLNENLTEFQYVIEDDKWKVNLK